MLGGAFLFAGLMLIVQKLSMEYYRNMSKIKFPENLNGVHIHFVGIKGTGMVALVEILNARGARITGSDVSEKFYTDEILDKVGIKALPFSKENITDDIYCVVYSSAYNPSSNLDLAEAMAKNIPMVLYSEALGAISETAFSAGICGVHGKTSTTGLTGTLLKATDLPCQVLAGSIISSFGNSCTMTSEVLQNAGNDEQKYFVAETCEYQRHFMAFAPKAIILTSVESDHQDYYPTYEDIRDAFIDYILKLPENGTLIYCADDSGAVETAGIATKKRPDINLIPYGITAQGDYGITFGEVSGGRQKFTVASYGEFQLCVPGNHNVLNATAALALTHTLLVSDGKDPEEYSQRLKDALLTFAGGKRRSEIVGRAKTPNGQEVIFIDDYGHHPTAVKTTLNGFRKFYGKHKIIVDFMSHTYTRTQALLEEFASCFSDADEVIINKIYGSAREDASAASVTGEILAQHAMNYHQHVSYEGEFAQASEKGYELLCQNSGEEYPEGYVFVTMGAGDNWKVGKLLLEKLNG